MFNSDFCVVQYNEKEHVVLLTWKKFSYGENYRAPVSHALELLQNHPNSNLVIDARNGFEDDESDVEWGFTVFIPALAKTDCRHVVFIMNVVNEIEGEMDMWTKEFSKYFKVSRTASYSDAAAIIQGDY